MPKLKSVVAPVFAVIFCMTSAHAKQTEESCEKTWIVESKEAVGASSQTAALLKRWQVLEQQCGHTQIYRGRLALLQVMMGDFQSAERTLATAGKATPPFGFAIEAAAIQLAVEQRLKRPQALTASELRPFEESYRGLVQRYPQWPTGYALLGGIESTLGKHKEAIPNLMRALQGDAYNLSGVYRNLAISLSATEQWQKAIEAANRAYELQPSLTSDPPFVYAIADANTGLGKLDDAEIALKLILKKRPEVRNDPDFLGSVEFFNRMKKERR